MIRITWKVIWIPILVGLYKDHDSNHYSSNSNQVTRKGMSGCSTIEWFESLLNGFESNSSKGYFNGLIRITNQVIWIPGEVEVKLRVTDSNHPYSDSNPSWRTSEEIEAWIRITYIAIRIPHEEKCKMIRIFELWIRIPSQMK